MSSRMNVTNDSRPQMNKESRKGDIWRTNTNNHFENISLDASPRLDYLRDYDESDTAATEALSISPSTSKPSIDGGFHRTTFKSFSSDEFDFSSLKLPYRDPQSSLDLNGHNIFVPVLEGPTRSARHGESQIHVRDEVPYYRLQQQTKQGPIGKNTGSSLFAKEGSPLSPSRAKAMDDSRDNTSPLSSPTMSPTTLSPAHGLDSRSPGVDMKRPYVKHPSQIVIQPSMGMSSQAQSQQRTLSLQLSKNRQSSHPMQPRQLPDIQQSPKTAGWGNRSSAYTASPGSQVSSQGRHVQSPPPSNIGTASSSARSPQEVLKTLLRKKACLYEPGTSQAIAIITWIVGRGLALQQGYFTRQHLQSGVHLAVAEKIDSGFITRTKVNRCMQCILNSCFHYIIPRPDGSEEKGDSFQALFHETVVDDSHLIRSLPRPWGDIKLNWDHIFECIKLDEAGCKDDFENEHLDHDGSVDGNRRPVLLCFNDNVRSAEDVLRCHNEFIRDAAISANLVLSAEEWRSFFSRVDEDTSLTETVSESSVSGLSPKSPMMKGTSDKREEYHFTFDVTSFFAYQWPSHGHGNTSERWMKKPDYFGGMCLNDLARFRTEWCCKRYDHNHAVCRFAHASVNEGWLRRDPTKFQYSAKMCPHVTRIENESLLLSGCNVNACKDGLRCRYAHSQEEISFHPDQYKSLPCEPFRKSILSCESRDICPHFHPCDHHNNHYSRRQMDWSPRFKSISAAATKHHSLSKTCIIPEAASTLYVSPAPESEFEKTLIFPGIKSLFRRHGSTIIAHHCGYTQKDCHYSLFGDNWGLPSKAFPINITDSALSSFSLYSD